MAVAVDNAAAGEASDLECYDKGWNYDYDVGFGFNIETKKDSYAFLDVERRFGNGNKNSYQINGGFYWAL